MGPPKARRERPAPETLSQQPTGPTTNRPLLPAAVAQSIAAGRQSTANEPLTPAPARWIIRRIRWRLDGISCQLDDLLPLISEAIDRGLPLRLDVDEIGRNIAAVQEVADSLRGGQL
jgi:hypothetical protein